MKLANKFKFGTTWCDTVYTATGSEETDYRVTWTPDFHGDSGRMTYSPAHVRRLITNGTWRIKEVIVPAPETVEPGAVDEVIRIRHKATNEREYNLIRQADGQYRFDDMDHAGWSAEQGQRFFDNGTWIRIVDADKLVSDSLTADKIEARKLDLTPIIDVILPDEPSDIGFGYSEEEVAALNAAEPVPSFGVSLDDLRRFSAETGFVVEVDADFCSVYLPGESPTKFLAADDAELATVMQAVRTLNDAVDRG